jgi:hypothetical protein
MEEMLGTPPPRGRTGRRMSSFDVPASTLVEPGRRVPTAAALFRRRVSLDDGAHQRGAHGSPHPLARRKMSVGGSEASYQLMSMAKSKSKSTPSTSTTAKSASSGSPTMVRNLAHSNQRERCVALHSGIEVISQFSRLLHVSPPSPLHLQVCSFGGNEFAQLGCEGVLMHTEPQPIEPLENVIYISAGWTSNMALTCTPAAFLPSLPHPAAACRPTFIYLFVICFYLFVFPFICFWN